MTAQPIHPTATATDAAVDDLIAARRRAYQLEEEGLVGTVLVEPLTALAGGILGGALVSAAAWRLAWRTRNTRAVRAAARPFRR